VSSATLARRRASKAVVAPAARQQGGGGTGGGVGRPPLDRGLQRVVAGGGRPDPAPLRVPVDHPADLTVTESFERVAFPRVGLAAVVDQVVDGAGMPATSAASAPPGPRAPSWR